MSNNGIGDCIFCAIIARTVPSVIIAENDHVLVIKDRAPKAPIHYLIIPKKHIADLRDWDPEKYPAMGEELLRMARQLSLLSDGDDTRDFRLVMNNGFKAGQRVFHAHMHFLAGASFSD